MKLAAVSIILLAGIFVVVFGASSCSINHRSGDYTCTKQQDCAAGRTCQDGFCVLTMQLDSGVGKIDAPKQPPPDAGDSCPSQCTSCDTVAKTCVVDCAVNPNTCNGPVVCPTGYACDIRCTTTSSCRSGVNCLNATSCKLDCSGSESCRNVACGTGKCNVDCAGTGSCRGIGCAQSCACDVTCHAGALCTSITCPSGCFNTGLPGCTSQAPMCNTCP